MVVQTTIIVVPRNTSLLFARSFILTVSADETIKLPFSKPEASLRVYATLSDGPLFDDAKGKAAFRDMGVHR